jgi:hypothetical protein
MASPTRYVVGALMGAAMATALYFMVAPGWGMAGAAVVLFALTYEGWTLVNRWPNDTISEIVWTLSARPMVPFVFGVATGWAVAAGAFPNIATGIAWGFLMGHFFFQRQED